MNDASTLAPDHAAMRHAMVVSQLRPNGVSDARIVTAMGRVEREAFLPAMHRDIAYRDALLPLSGGRVHNSPLATARLLNQARLRAGERMLIIGAAGGYAAAVAAGIVGAVVALEDSAELLAIAGPALGGIANVTLAEGPLAQGWDAGAPYDVVMIDGAVEQVPAAIVDQLQPGGRIVTGLVDRGVTRLAAGERTEGGFGLIDFIDLDCAILPGFALPRGFTF